MGSYNTICNLTKRIITPGDKCYIIPSIIMKEGSVTLSDGSTYRPQASTVYTMDTLVPIGVMIEAAYDDYGRFTWENNEITRAQLAQLMLYLNEVCVELPQGSNEFHEKDVSPSMFDLNNVSLEDAWDYLSDRLHSNRVIIKEHDYLTNLVFKIYSKDAADILANIVKERPKEYVAEPLKQFQSLEGKEAYSFFKEMNQDLYFPNLKVFFTHDGFSIVNWYDFFKEVNYSEEYFNLFQYLYLFKQIETGCNLLNIIPHAQAYGSQDYQNISGLMYASFINKCSEQELKNLEESYKEDDEEFPGIFKVSF